MPAARATAAARAGDRRGRRADSDEAVAARVHLAERADSGPDAEIVRVGAGYRGDPAAAAFRPVVDHLAVVEVDLRLFVQDATAVLLGDVAGDGRILHHHIAPRRKIPPPFVARFSVMTELRIVSGLDELL